MYQQVATLRYIFKIPRRPAFTLAINKGWGHIWKCVYNIFNQFFMKIENRVMSPLILISRDAANTNLLVFGLIQPGKEPTIYCTRDESECLIIHLQLWHLYTYKHWILLATLLIIWCTFGHTSIFSILDYFRNNGKHELQNIAILDSPNSSILKTYYLTIYWNMSKQFKVRKTFDNFTYW